MGAGRPPLMLSSEREASWLEKTHQRWKLWAASGCYAVALSVVGVAVRVDSDAAVLAGVSGFVLFGGVGAWLDISVRCSRCGRSVTWWAAPRLGLTKLLGGLRRWTKCPICGDEPDPAS